MLDFLIVGQGIAGSILALQLLKHGQRVLVIGNRDASSASKVAAGLYNPVTGREMTETWMADALFPYLSQFYQAAEKTLNARFLYPMPIFRPFISAEEQGIWQAKTIESGRFITDLLLNSPDSVHQYGGLLLQQSGYVDTRCFVEATRSYLEKSDAYFETDFVHNKLYMGPEGVNYEGLSAQKVIFCEGVQALQNPFFSTLSFRPVKGELLRVELQRPLTKIYNRGVFVVPQVGRQALVGATYDHQNLTCLPSKKAKRVLEERLGRNFNLAYTVQDHWVGVRPATFDRRPFIGLHPRYPQLGIFNGLGAKGVSLAPYLAKNLVNHLLNHQPLLEAVALRREKHWVD